MPFDALVQRMVTDPHLQSAIAELKRRKMAGDELDRGPRNEVISSFLERKLDRLYSAQRPMPNAKPTLEEADALFRSVLR